MIETLRRTLTPRVRVAVSCCAPVSDAVRMMAAEDIPLVPVLDDGRMAGVLSERDVARRVIDRGLDPAHTLVGDVMTPEVVLADVDEDCGAAMRRMDAARSQHLLVVSRGRPFRMLSLHDVRRAAGAQLRALGDLGESRPRIISPR
jgi:predicted transcriptional regulator